MQQDIAVTFYNVKQCGYYKRSDDHQFGDAAGTLAALKTWSTGKTLEDTLLLEPAEDDGLEPTYLYGMAELNGEYLLCTWNQVESTGDEIATVHAREPVGSANVTSKSIEPGTIPGYATYFWFIPNQNIFATVRFQHRKNGQRNMQHYLENYLHWFSPHVVHDAKVTDSVKILGYTKTPGGPDKPQSLYPRFRTAVGSKAGEFDMLRTNRSRIRKVIRRATLQLNNQPDKVFWQKAIEFLTMQQRVNAGSAEIEYSVELTPTQAELEAMFQDWDLRQAIDDWDDYGFVLESQSGQTHWLGHGKVSGSFKVDVRRQNIEIVDLDGLLRELHRKRLTILQLLS